MARKQNGFTLIEMAIALVIMGVILSGAMKLATANLAGRQNATLNASVEAATIDAVLLAARNKQIERVCVDGPSGCDNNGCGSSCSTYPTKYLLEDDSTTGHLDPWDMPVRYVRYAGSVTVASDPDEIAFVIISDGPDSIAGTGDDLEREVTASEVLALIAKMGIGG
jgi:prepilin-type N-terminal cleavage/methylation domain-containing protein